MQPGTKVRTLYEFSASGVIVRPRAANLPMPGPDWRLVRFDDDRGQLCIHVNMLAVRNEQ